jgi:protoporphyrin/coproporphyrin ferrochelatase
VPEITEKGTGGAINGAGKGTGGAGTIVAGAPVGVLLLNLGGPDTCEGVESFLYRLFSDREIIQFPGGAGLQPVWARLLSRLRAPSARRNYAAIGGGSPLLALTWKQARALEAALNADAAPGAPGSGSGAFRVGVAMRYWSPTSDEALTAMREAGASRVVALSLYPQFSSVTTQSSLNELRRASTRLGLDAAVRITTIDRYPDHPGYLEAMAEAVEEGLAGFPREEQARTVLLFSAHGLPEKVVRAGDPYPEEIRRTREGILRALGERRPGQPWRLGYQSRTGPLRWIGPSTEEVIRELARAGTRSVLVVPLAFVSDHIETLYEIDQLYAGLARRLGISDFRRCRMLHDDPRFIAALASMVRDHLREALR